MLDAYTLMNRLTSNDYQNMSIYELENQIFEITKKQNQITHWGLSEKTEQKVIFELESQKENWRKIIHNKVDKL